MSVLPEIHLLENMGLWFEESGHSLINIVWGYPGNNLCQDLKSTRYSAPSKRGWSMHFPPFDVLQETGEKVKSWLRTTLPGRNISVFSFNQPVLWTYPFLPDLCEQNTWKRTYSTGPAYLVPCIFFSGGKLIYHNKQHFSKNSKIFFF